MNLNRRIEAVEKRNAENESAWIQGLTDEDLKLIAKGGEPALTEWLKTLTEDELFTIRDGKRGAVNLMERYELEKQN